VVVGQATNNGKREIYLRVLTLHFRQTNFADLSIRLTVMVPCAVVGQATNNGYVVFPVDYYKQRLNPYFRAAKLWRLLRFAG
jgi:hypothetical protein